jgi:hypothetical protein
MAYRQNRNHSRYLGIPRDARRCITLPEPHVIDLGPKPSANAKLCYSI